MITPPKFRRIKEFRIKKPEKWDLTSKDIEERIDIVKELLSLSKEEYREVMENKLEELFKGVKAFKEIAKKIIDTRDKFYVCPILAEVRDVNMHIATKVSENLNELPVYIRHLDYTHELKLFTFKVFLPATKDMLDFTFDEIAFEQKKIIEKTLEEIDSRYKKVLVKIELDKRIPSPLRRIYNREGCWLSWVFKMVVHPEFWTMSVSELPYATRIPFIATPYYEFVMLMSDRINYPHMRKIKDELVKEAEKDDRHSIRLSKVEDIEISYSWFEKKEFIKEIRQAGKIDERMKIFMTMDLESNLTSKGHKVSGMILGEKDKTPTGKDAKKDVEIASTIWEEEVIKTIPNFRYKDETFEKCVIKGEFKMELL